MIEEFPDYLIGWLVIYLLFYYFPIRVFVIKKETRLEDNNFLDGLGFILWCIMSFVFLAIGIPALFTEDSLQEYLAFIF